DHAGLTGGRPCKGRSRGREFCSSERPETGLRPFARDQESPSISPASLRKICSEEGTLGSPGMVMISPVITTMNPAPAESLTSRIGTVWPVGAPRRFGSVEKEYCVLAMQIGRLP